MKKFSDSFYWLANDMQSFLFVVFAGLSELSHSLFDLLVPTLHLLRHDAQLLQDLNQHEQRSVQDLGDIV